MSDGALAKSWDIASIKAALPAIMSAGPDVMAAEKRMSLLGNAAAALMLAATKAALTAESVADVELAAQAAGELVKAFRSAAAPAAAPAATVESGQTAGGHTLVAAAGKAEGVSDSEIRDALRGALEEKFPRQETEDGWINRIYIADVFSAEKLVVYEHDAGFFQIGYSYDGTSGAVTLTGDPVEVRRVYQPLGAAPAAEPSGVEEAPAAAEPAAEQPTAASAAKTAKAAAPTARIPVDLGAAYRKRREAEAAAAAQTLTQTPA